jgi:hypothetical protein
MIFELCLSRAAESVECSSFRSVGALDSGNANSRNWNLGSKHGQPGGEVSCMGAQTSTDDRYLGSDGRERCLGPIESRAL